MKNRLFKLVTAVLALTAVSVFAEEKGFQAGFWFDTPKGITGSTCVGFSLGLPVCASRSVEGIEFALCGGCSKQIDGFQWALFGFTQADTLSGCQLSFVNLVEVATKGVGVQVGIFNQSIRGGYQIGFVNNGLNNSDFQFGFININRNGYFPAMFLVNWKK